ncbi:DUF6311 domain-containing protein [Vreelandella venusta]|uniref:DUF6311 domain-containing protein n=1 Tax=Vreelandella venusta TaxID=44935 RepID=UPI003C2FA6E5
MDIHRRLAIMLAACIAGLLAGYLYAGILNPLKVEWLLQEGDLLQHFLGWHYYRHEAWGWPIGALHTYGTEVRSSIVFTDSLPLLAIPLKLFQEWLPDPFQYQGLASWGHVVLNATAACCIFTRFRVPALAAISLSLVVAFMPAVLFRGPGGAGHESLMGHWAFLFAIYLVLFRQNTRWVTCSQWCLLLTAAVMVHFYLFLLVGIFWSLWWLLASIAHYRSPSKHNLKARWWLAWGVYSLLQPAFILSVMWAVGYLHSSSDSPGADGFGFYSAELATYFNAYSFLPDIISVSAFLPLWVPGNVGQYEGMAYVGLGVLVLWAVALLLYIKQPLPVAAEQKWRINSLAALAVGLFVFALSDKVALGPFAVDLPLPWPETLRTILRASGRMVWVLMYLAIFAAAFMLARRLAPRSLVMVAMGVLALQMFDLRHWHQHFYQRSQQAEAYRMENDPRFNGWQTPELQQALSQRQALHVTHADDIVGMLPLAWLAGQHHMAINIAYVARITLPIIHQATAPTLKALAAGQLDPNVVYAITSPETAQQTCSLTNVQCVATPLATFAWQPIPEEMK